MGKTHCPRHAIRSALDDEHKVLIATPTGFLGAMYAHYFLDEINTDTIHSAFKYPVFKN